MICEWCYKARHRIDAHHLGYDRLGREGVRDLALICRDCHDSVEAFVKRMVAAGRDRRRVLDRLRPYFVRRLDYLLELKYDSTEFGRAALRVFVSQAAEEFRTYRLGIGQHIFKGT